MPFDDFMKTLVVQLPNFAGLLICVIVELKIILLLWEDNQHKQARINELCGDTTPDE